MGWLLLVDQFQQGIGKTKLGIGVLSFGSDPRAADKRIIGPEYKGKSIEEEDLFFHAPKVKKWREGGVKTQQPRLALGETGLLIC